MAAGLARFDGQASVEQHNALIRPRRQIAVRGHGYAEVIRQLLVYIGQTTRDGLDIGRHAEAQSHRMTGGWIGVLAHDKHLDAVEWDGEGAQNVRAGGKIPASGCDSPRRKSPMRCTCGSTSARAFAHPGSTRSFNGLMFDCVMHLTVRRVAVLMTGVVWFSRDGFTNVRNRGGNAARLCSD